MATQGIKMDDEMSGRLKSLAVLKDRTPHWIMKTAISEYLEREERYELEKAEDEERWQKYLLTGEAYTMEEVGAWLQELAAGKAPSSWRG